jgi:hypothetical protein
VEAVEQGSWPRFPSSDYRLRYQYRVGGEWSQPVIKDLVKLPSSRCLAVEEFTGVHPAGRADSVRLAILVQSSRTGSLLLTDERPLAHSVIREWALYRTRSMLSSIFLFDRWYVWGSVRVDPDSLGTDPGRVRIGLDTFRLNGATATGGELPCVIPQSAVQELSFPSKCLSFGGIWAGRDEPRWGRISFANPCSTDLSRCHFAKLTSESRFLLPPIGFVACFVLAFLVVFARDRWPSLFPKPGAPPALPDWKRIAWDGTRMALLFIWLVEVYLWSRPGGTMLGTLWELLIPAAVGLLFAPPKMVAEAMQKLVASTLHPAEHHE